MTRWLITGAGGMLGQDLVSLLRERSDIRLTSHDRTSLDITDAATVADAVAGHDLVINTAAWTDVDGAEVAEEQATDVNGTAVAHLARACAATDARLLQVSTDYVFAGDATTPYPEDAPTGPCNAYGRGKLIGEQAVCEHLPQRGYIVRTAWLYATHGRNFLTTVMRLASEREVLDVVDDQLGQPTWSFAFATRLIELGEAALAGRAPAGVYHGTASGETTWYGFARQIFVDAGLDPARVRPTTTANFPRPARRPAYSVLGHRRWALAGLAPMDPWQRSLATAMRLCASTSAAGPA